MSVVLEEPIVWFVGQTRDGNDEIQGISKTREGAEAMCRDENYFITPVELEVSYPHETEYLIEGENVWYPKKVS